MDYHVDDFEGARRLMRVLVWTREDLAFMERCAIEGWTFEQALERMPPEMRERIRHALEPQE